MVETSVIQVPTNMQSKCKKCGLCMKNCPTHAIKLNPYPEINPVRCIRCDVCYIFCPNHALKIDRPLLE
jgi:MinD superfamily P-loop ATPase